MCAIGLCLCAGIAGAELNSGQDQVTVTRVVVNRSNIFDLANKNASQPQAVQLIADNINSLHRTTRESVILREAGVAPGDKISVAEVANLERRLRNLGIFASVSTSLITADDGIELHITTQDSFSIVAGASGSYLGGVGDIGFTVGEKNLSGTGNELLFTLSRTTTGNFRGSAAFSDLHFFDRPWKTDYAVGRTNEGNFLSFRLGDTFKSLGDGRQWSVTTDYTERNRNYYQDGNIVLQIPEQRSRLVASHVWRRVLAGVNFSDTKDTSLDAAPQVQSFLRKGVELSIGQSEFSAAGGSLSDVFLVPDNNRRLYIGGLLAHDQVQGFRKVQGVDTLNFVQDIRLGSAAQIQLGVNFVEDFESAGSTSSNDPFVAITLDKSFAAGKNSLLRVFANGNATLEEAGARPWNATVGLKAYNTKIDNLTLALNANYSTGEDGTDLPVQLTLGESNGLRGYDIRQFAGRSRVRMNLEARYRTNRKLGVLDVGLVGFADAGWVASDDEFIIDDASQSIRSSVGVGLRLASNSLLGPRVIRIDLALPLDAPDGDSANPSLSAAVGQVFRF